MAVAIPFGTRQQIVQMRTQGKSYRQISQELGASYDAVRRIHKRQQQQGEAGLLPDYKRCGVEGIRLSAFYHRVSLCLKRVHPLTIGCTVWNESAALGSDASTLV